MTTRHDPKPVVTHGWTLFAHLLFLDQVDALIRQVENLRRKNPSAYQQKNPTKRLAAILELISKTIPQDPTRPEYRQGDALGEEYRHWFRAKFYQQYHLFFRYHLASRIIVFAWVNDQGTKRAYESGDDAYKVFGKMLAKGHPPDDWDTLLREAKAHATRLGKTLGS